MKLRIISALIITLLLTVKPIPAQEKLVFSTFPATNPVSKICQAIMQTAYKKIGIEAIIQHYPPARGIQLANEGHTDGELYRSIRINGRFSNLVMVPVPITHTEVVAFTKNIQFPIKGWDSLKPYRIGVERGFILVETKTEGMKTHSAKVEQTFKMLNAERVDVVVSTRLEGVAHIKNLQLKGINILNPLLEKDAVHHFLHKKHQKIIPKLAATLEKMKKTGKIDAIKKQVEETLFKELVSKLSKTKYF